MSESLVSILVSWPDAATPPSLEELKFRFLRYGPISSVDIMAAKKNSAKIHFLKKEQAATAAKSMDKQLLNGYPLSVKVVPAKGGVTTGKMLQPFTDCRFFLEDEACRPHCPYRHHRPTLNVVCEAWKQRQCRKVTCHMLHPNHEKGFPLSHVKNQPTPEGPSLNVSCNGRCSRKNCNAKFRDMDSLLAHLRDGSDAQSVAATSYVTNSIPMLAGHAAHVTSHQMPHFQQHHPPPLPPSNAGYYPHNQGYPHPIPGHQLPANGYPPPMPGHQPLANRYPPPTAGYHVPVGAGPHLVSGSIPSLMSTVAAGAPPQNLEELEPIGIFWDIENCRVPCGKSAGAVVNRIREIYLAGRREVEFMCVCDTTKEKQGLIDALNDAQVTIVHVKSTAKNAADDKIRQALRRFAKEFTPPTTVVLVSSDINFLPDLSDLRYRHGFRVVLIHNSQTSGKLVACASEARRFDHLVQDVEVQGPHEETAKPAFLLVTNLSQLSTEATVKPTLELLSSNCGGKFVAFARTADCNEALLKFSNKQLANKCHNRLQKERIDKQPIKTLLIEDCDDIPKQFTWMPSHKDKYGSEPLYKSVEEVSKRSPMNPVKNNVAQSMVSLSSTRRRSRSRKESLSSAADTENGTVTLGLGNLNSSVPAKQLVWAAKKEIGKHYNVVSLSLIDHGKGTGTVTLKTSDTAAVCKNTLSGKRILGRLIFASSKSKKTLAEIPPSSNDSTIQQESNTMQIAEVKDRVIAILKEMPLGHATLKILQSKFKRFEDHTLTAYELSQMKDEVFIGGKPGKMIACYKGINVSNVKVNESNLAMIQRKLVDVLREHGSSVPVVSVPGIYWSYTQCQLASQSGVPVLSLIQADCFSLKVDGKGRMVVGLVDDESPTLKKVVTMIESSTDVALSLKSIKKVATEMFGHDITLQQVVQLQSQHPDILKIGNAQHGGQILTFHDGYKMFWLERNLEHLLQSEGTVLVNDLVIVYYMFYGRLLLPSSFDHPSIHALIGSLPPKFKVSTGKGQNSITLADEKKEEPDMKNMSTLENEIENFLCSKPSRTVMFGAFQAEFMLHFGRQLKTKDYGFPNLESLLHALPLDLKFTGQGVHKFLTLMKTDRKGLNGLPPAVPQVTAVTLSRDRSYAPAVASTWKDVTKLLHDSPSGALPVVLNNAASMLNDVPPHMQVFGDHDIHCAILLPSQTVNIEKCCDLLANFLHACPDFSATLMECSKIPELASLLNHCDLPLEFLFSCYPERFNLKGIHFSLTQTYARTLVIDNVIALLLAREGLTIPFAQIVPSYHQKFGRQLVLRSYGAAKLRDLLLCETDMRLEISDKVKLGIASVFENEIEMLLQDFAGALPLEDIKQCYVFKFQRHLDASRFDRNNIRRLLHIYSRKLLVLGHGEQAIVLLKEAVHTGFDNLTVECGSPDIIHDLSCTTLEETDDEIEVVSAASGASDKSVPTFPRLATNFSRRK